MKLRHTILVLFTLSTSFTNAQNGAETISIDVNNQIKVPYTQLAKTSIFIPLVKDSAYTILDIDKVYLSKDKIIILDKTMNGIYSFNRAGKFLYKVGKKGSGVGDYLRAEDIGISKNGIIIEILDGLNNKLITYVKGKFIKERDIHFDVSGFSYLTQSKIIFNRDIAPTTPDLMYQAILTDSNFNIINTFLKVTKTSDLVFSPQNSLQKFGNSVTMLPIYSPYIYSVSADGITEKYFLDFGGNWFTDKFIYSRENPSNFVNELAESDYVYFLNVVDGDNYLTITFTFKGIQYTAVYNKASKQLRFISDLHSDYCGEYGFKAYQEGNFVSVINNPQSLLNSIKEGKIKLNESEIDNLKNAIGYNNNHILMLTNFKF